jgi:replicative DNA helicase
VSESRGLPQSLEAEQSALGAMLLGGVEAVAATLEAFEGRAFYRENHRHIFEAIIAVYESGEIVDLITVGSELRKRGWLEECGGAAYLSALLESCPSAKNIRAYLRPVQDSSDLRDIAVGAQRIREAAHADDADPNVLVGMLEELAVEISRRRQTGTLRAGDDVLAELMAHFKVRQEGVTPGIATGFRDLDEMLGGLQPGEMTIIAARPGMGKSAYAMNIAQHIAQQQHAQQQHAQQQHAQQQHAQIMHRQGMRAKLPVIVFSLEMTAGNLMERMVAGEAHIEGRALKRGWLDGPGWNDVAEAVERLWGMPIFICDVSQMTTLQMRARVRNLAAQYGGVALVVVDYLQIVDEHAKDKNRQEALQAMVRSLAAMAKDHACPALVLSALNRRCEEREDKRPNLADLRESGAIEAEAHVVAFLYRDAYYRKGKPARVPLPQAAQWGPQPPDEPDNIAEVIIAKNRNGPTGTVKLTFLAEYARFENLG